VAEASLDGRLSRAARSRQAICDACLDLIQEGVLQPGADQVADRAGLSRRSIFYHFKDLAELYDAVVEAAMLRCAPLWKEVPGDLPLRERVQMLVEVRSKFFEATAAFTRALTAQALAGAATAQARRVARDALDRQRGDVERVFTNELEGLPTADRGELLEALAAAANAPTWEYLRRTRSLSMTRARGVVGRTLSSLLGV
jgi:AcrR family transcriptional regulator